MVRYALFYEEISTIVLAAWQKGGARYVDFGRDDPNGSREQDEG